VGHAECAGSEPERFNEQVQGRAGQNARFDNRVPIDAADCAMRSDAKYSSPRSGRLGADRTAADLLAVIGSGFPTQRLHLGHRLVGLTN